MGKRAKKNKKVRIEDIAAMCGVSLSTVSRALAGEKGVRPEVRARILEMAQNANYAMPARLIGQKVIVAASGAAMIDYMRNQFTLYVLEGLQQRARMLEIELVTRSISGSDDERALLQEALEDDQVIGLLFLTIDDETLLAAAEGFSKPIILVNSDDPLMRLSSVTPCNRSCARVATNRLIALGHERILFLMRPGRRTIERRFEGWRDAMQAHGLAAGDDLVMTVEDWLPELAGRAVMDRVAEGLDFTAILTAGDSLAIGAMMGLQQMGIAVPGDVSVMGIDDLPQAAFLNPPLSSMHIPMRDIGAVALDLLQDHLSPLHLPPRRIELACHLVERSSTGPCRDL